MRPRSFLRLLTILMALSLCSYYILPYLFFSVASPTSRKQEKKLSPVNIRSHYLTVAGKVMSLLCVQVYFCDLLNSSPLYILWAVGYWSGDLKVKAIVLYLIHVLQIYCWSKFAPNFFFLIIHSCTTFDSVVFPC